MVDAVAPLGPCAPDRAAAARPMTVNAWQSGVLPRKTVERVSLAVPILAEQPAARGA